MKGIILAGDSGSRLHPLTLGIHKQLIPIYDKPMIYYPIDILVKAGITELLIITIEEQQTLFRKSGNATIFVENKTYDDQYGRVVMDKDRKPLSIEGDMDTNYYYSIASLYVFPSKVVDIAKGIMPSERGRYEILDVNKRFFEECKLQVQVLDSKCIWFDTNTFDNILKCSNYMKQKQFNNR